MKVKTRILGAMKNNLIFHNLQHFVLIYKFNLSPFVTLAE